MAECDSDSLIFLLIPQDTSFAGSQIGAGGGDGENAGLLSYEAGGLDTETGDVQCLDVGGGDDGQGNAELSGGGEDAGLDFGKVRVSRGSLTPAAGASVGRLGGRVVFTWSDNSGEGDAAADDVALLLVYNKKRGDAVYSLSGAVRSDREASLPLPRGWETDELVVFLSFRSSDGRRVSNSICLNEGILVTFSEDSPASFVSGGAMRNGQWRLASALLSPASAVNGLLTRRSSLSAAVQRVEARGHPVAAGGRPPLG